jgi:hypothetical protein
VLISVKKYSRSLGFLNFSIVFPWQNCGCPAVALAVSTNGSDLFRIGLFGVFSGVCASPSSATGSLGEFGVNFGLVGGQYAPDGRAIHAPLG